MTDQEITLIVQELIDKALNGETRRFNRIMYWREFRYYKRLRLSTRLVIKTLKASASNLFKEYCHGITTGTSDITKLLTYCQLLDIIDFYENDLETIQLMLDDYNEYICDYGNFIRALFGVRREE